MQSSGSVTIGAVAIVSGLLGAYGLRALFLPDPPPLPPPPPTLTVPLAAVDLPVGRQIVLHDIALHRMTQKQMASQGLADSTVMLAPEQIIGRVLQEPVERGKAFLTTSMFLQGDQPNLSESLQPGFRAVSLEIPVIRGGMTAPGTFVDVLFRTNAQAGTSDPRVRIPEATMTLFEGVEVIALEKPQSYRAGTPGFIDLRLGNDQDSIRTTPPRVTLAVTLQQASVLRTVEGRGEITLAPRSMNEGLPLASAQSSTGSAFQGSGEAEVSTGAATKATPAESQPIDAALDNSDSRTTLTKPVGSQAIGASTAPVRQFDTQATLSTVLQPFDSMTLEGLLGLKVPEEPFRTEIYRGGSRQVHVFDAAGSPLVTSN